MLQLKLQKTLIEINPRRRLLPPAAGTWGVTPIVLPWVRLPTIVVVRLGGGLRPSAVDIPSAMIQTPHWVEHSQSNTVRLPAVGTNQLFLLKIHQTNKVCQALTKQLLESSCIRSLQKDCRTFDAPFSPCHFACSPVSPGLQSPRQPNPQSLSD